jgi:hypothetical protein
MSAISKRSHAVNLESMDALCERVFSLAENQNLEYEKLVEYYVYLQNHCMN